MARKMIIPISDELDKEMSRYPEVDWVDTVQTSLRECIRRKEIANMYTDPVERAFCNRK